MKKKKQKNFFTHLKNYSTQDCYLWWGIFLQCATFSQLKDLKNPSTNNVKDKNHPKMKIHSLSTHPSADGKSGEVFVLHKNISWSFTAQQCLRHSPKQLKKLGTCFIKLTKQPLIRHNPSLWKLQGARWSKKAILTPFFSTGRNLRQPN